MNNSRIIIDDLNLSVAPEVDISTKLRQRESELVTIIEGIHRINAHADWKNIDNVLFKPLVENLERQLKAESEKEDVSLHKLYKIQGKLEIARKYQELNLDNFRNELSNVRKQLKN
jgi:hypothetical protein